MKVALVHDWLTGLRGGERCLQALVALYPDADIFTLVHVPGATSAQIDARVRGTSLLQSLPGVRKYYRALLPLFPAAARSLDLSGYDLVVSISHAAVKNVRVDHGAVHICYCLTPMRYAWDQATTYFGAATPLLEPLVRYLRAWDRSGSERVDCFVAISRFVAARIRAFYRRPSEIIYPPIDSYWYSEPLPQGPGSGFLFAGALVPYKGADLAVDACSQLGQPLVVVGDGPLRARLMRRAGPHVRFLGRVSDAELRERYRSTKALLFPAREDFGMIPIECMAAGRPVIAPWSGATKETVRGCASWRSGWPQVGSQRFSVLDAESPTGVLFPYRWKGEGRGPGRAQTLAALTHAISVFLDREADFRPAGCRSWATPFGMRRFFEQWVNLPALARFRGAGVAIETAVADLESAERGTGEDRAAPYR
jgi:glycosyltransferase involved in cell wall biosynthesis